MTSPQYSTSSGPPSSLLDYYASVEAGSNRRFDAGIAATARDNKARLDNEYRIAKLQASTAAESLAVDKWYKEQQVALAQKTFDENTRQFDKNFGLSEADTTGWYGGKPTLKGAEQTYQHGVTDASLTGQYGGAPTLEARELERKYGLAAGELTGVFQGQNTAAERERLARLGMSEADVTGLYHGQQTAAERERLARLGISQGELTGQYQGSPTEAAREFNLRQGLQNQQFGLDVAKTAADLRSRPDMLFQYQQFAQSLPGLLQGQGGTAPAAGSGPQGQTIAGTLGEVGMGGMQGPWNPGMGYLAPAAGGPGGGGGAMSPEGGWYGPGGTGVPGQPAAPAAQPLAENEQARYVQLVARARQIAASGGPGLEGDDLAELQRYQARVGVPPGSEIPRQPQAGPGGTPYGGGGAGGYMVQGPAGEWQQGGPEMVYAQGGGGYGGGGGNAMQQGPNGQWQAYGAGYGSGGGPGSQGQAGGGGAWYQPYGDWSKAQAGGPSADMAYLSAAQTGAGADPTLAAIGKTYQQGFQRLGAQSLESMDKNDLGFLRSGGSFQGYDFDREMRKYAGSRIGQSVGG